MIGSVQNEYWNTLHNFCDPDLWSRSQH